MVTWAQRIKAFGVPVELTLKSRAGGRRQRRQRRGAGLHRRVAEVGDHLPGAGRHQRAVPVDHDGARVPGEFRRPALRPEVVSRRRLGRRPRRPTPTTTTPAAATPPARGRPSPRTSRDSVSSASPTRTRACGCRSGRARRTRRVPAAGRTGSTRRGELFKLPAYAQFRGISYFNSFRPGTPCNWVLTQDGAAARWAVMGGDPFYGGTTPPPPAAARRRRPAGGRRAHRVRGRGPARPPRRPPATR